MTLDNTMQAHALARLRVMDDLSTSRHPVGEPQKGMDPLRLAAVHEAGHIIAAARCGLRVISASITQTADHVGRPYFLGSSHVRYTDAADESVPCSITEARVNMAVLMAGVASENAADSALLGLPNEWERDADPRQRRDMERIRRYLELFPRDEHNAELLLAYSSASRLISNSLPVMIALVNSLTHEALQGRGLFEDRIQALTGALEPLS